MSNVMPIKKDSPQERQKKAEIYRQLCSIINDGLTERFYLVQPEIGKKLVIEEYAPGIVRYVPKQHVVNCLLTHLEKYHEYESKFALTNEEGHFCVKYWMATGAVISTPKIVGELNETALVFHRLPFDICDGLTPTFDEFFARCSNALSIQAWIGSLFFEESDRQQYVWIYGEGGDGKGALTHTLEKVFGPSSCCPGLPEKGAGRFWTYQLLGKRLITLPECQLYTFPNSTLFKQLTGGDSVSFEQKGQDSFTTRPNCKFLFSSNERPKIDSARANQRRIIYGEVQSPTQSVDDLIATAVIEGAMWNEVPHFIYRCKELFLKLSPGMGIIPTDNRIFKDLADLNEETEDVIFHKYFTEDKHSNVLSSELKTIYKNEGFSPQEIRTFQKFISRKYKCIAGRTNAKPQRRCWFGIKMKSKAEQASDNISDNGEYTG